MQTSVAAAARRMWVATVDSTATSRGVRGEPGRPADINNAVGHRKTPQHCKERSAARATMEEYDDLIPELVAIAKEHFNAVDK